MYKCIKRFSLYKCNDNGSLEDEEIMVIENTVWTLSKQSTPLIGDIRLESDNLEWIEITQEGLNEYFIEIEKI